MPHSKLKKYVIKDFPDPKDIIIASVNDIEVLFWNGGMNGDAHIIRKLKLPKGITNVIKAITDKTFKERIKDSDYQEHQDKWKLDHEC
jgi:hypothetical protein